MTSISPLPAFHPEPHIPVPTLVPKNTLDNCIWLKKIDLNFFSLSFLQTNCLECVWDIQLGLCAPSFAAEFSLLENITGPGVRLTKFIHILKTKLKSKRFFLLLLFACICCHTGWKSQVHWERNRGWIGGFSGEGVAKGSRVAMCKVRLFFPSLKLVDQTVSRYITDWCGVVVCCRHKTVEGLNRAVYLLERLLESVRYSPHS